MPQTLSKSNNAVIQRYGSGENFAKTFNPDLQRVCAANVERAFSGDAPSIAMLLNTYTEKQVRVWILAQLENLNTFAGTKNKMEPPQMLMLSDVILTEYYYLKASELLLFFFQFKAGKYGELYGSVDPLRVSSALIEFDAYRRSELFRIDNKRKAEQRKISDVEKEKTAITIQQYRRLKFKRSKKVWKKKSASK